MSVWPAILGILLLAFTFREVFRDLFHPTATGSLSDFVASGIFNLFRRFPPLLTDAAPLAMVLVILIWAGSVCLGFALIYWALPPSNFKIQSGQPPTGFLSMVYFSLEVLTTLGLGDYAPIPIWLRLLATLEALVGFGLVTASISSIVLLDMALGRLRSLSLRASQMMRAEEEFGFSFARNDTESLFTSLSSDLARARVDFVQLPLTYYFYSDSQHASLPTVLPYLLKVAEVGLTAENNPWTRRAAGLLRLALKDLSDILRAKFLETDSDDCAVVFQAYAEHHRPR
jgi:hypothetical protein